MDNAFDKMLSKLKNYRHRLKLQCKRNKKLFLVLQQNRQLKAKLANANQQLELFHSYIKKTSDFILITNKNGVSHASNQSFRQHNGYTGEQIKQLALADFFAPYEIEKFNTSIWPTVNSKGEWKGKTKFIKNSGWIYPIYLSITSVHNKQHNVVAFICIFRDITAEEQHNQELIKLASQDSLTGLYNRRYFLTELDKKIKLGRHQQNKLALLWLDIDYFKQINDKMGHGVGDKILKTLAQNLTKMVRNTDTIARLGGDEFAILLCNTTINNAKISAQRIINTIKAHPIYISYQLFPITISMGVAMFPRDATNSRDLFIKADIALYKSKHANQNQLNFFHPNDTNQVGLGYSDVLVRHYCDKN